MAILRALLTNKSWIAHLLGLASLTGAEISQGATNPILLGAVTAMTAIFHICDALVKVKTPQVRIDVTPVSDAVFTPRVDALAPPLRNAAGDKVVE